jgi:flagellin
MTAQIRGLNQSVRNLNDGINMMQTAEGALVETSNMLQRMRELAVQSSNGTYSPTQRGYLQTEFAALSTQIGKIASETLWNGTQLLAATATFTFQAGAVSGQTISVAINPMTTTGLALTAGETVANVTGASQAITSLDAAINTVNSQRATIGAGINQMTYGADNLSSIAANTTASRSSIMDTDYATASTQLSKTQIIQQAATAMLAQANQQPQSVLALLK